MFDMALLLVFKFKLYLDFPSFMQWWQEVGEHQYAEVVFQWAWNLLTSKAFTLCGVTFLHLCFHIVCTILLLPAFVCICSILQYWWQEDSVPRFYSNSVVAVILERSLNSWIMDQQHHCNKPGYLPGAFSNFTSNTWWTFLKMWAQMKTISFWK
jgi:hypothetical protein